MKFGLHITSIGDTVNHNKPVKTGDRCKCRPRGQWPDAHAKKLLEGLLSLLTGVLTAILGHNKNSNFPFSAATSGAVYVPPKEGANISS